MSDHHAAAGIPQEAIDAAYAFTADWFVNHGFSEQEAREALRWALEAAAPHLRAAERERLLTDWRERVIGYRVDGHVYHPSDVDIIVKGPFVADDPAPGRYPSGATRDEGHRDGKWEDATS